MRKLNIFLVMALIAGIVPWWGILPVAAAPAVAPVAAPHANDIRISQVYGGGGNTGATYKNDFIELFNAGDTTVDVTGWSVQYASSAGTGAWAGATVLSGSIAPGQYYLIKEAPGAGGTVDLPAPEVTGILAMGGTNGKVALVSNSTLLNGQCPAGLIDLVGYGTANCSEGGSAAPALSSTTAALRAADGCTDADNNAADFTAVAPAPRNSASPTHSCGVSGGSLIVAKTGPATVLPGASYAYTLTVQNTTGAALTNVVLSDTLPSAVAYASSNPAGTWLEASHTITWNVASLANNTTLTYTLAVTAPTTWGAVSNAAYAAWAAEWLTPTSGSAVATAVKDCGSIEKIQANRDGNGDSLCKDESVTVEGIVYAVYTGAGYAISDGNGPWHGLYIYNGSGTKPALGDHVRVTGKVAEYYNMTELTGSSFTVLSSGNSLYAASVVDVADIANGATTAEGYESVFVEVHDVTVDGANLGNGEWSVAADGASVRVDDLGYVATPAVGDFFSVVRGMLNYSSSNFKIEPRNADDVIAGTPTGLLVSKTGSVSVTVESAFTYTLVVENQTATQLNDLVVSDTLPLDAAFASASPAGTWDAASHTITWTQASVAHNTTLTYTIVVTAPAESAILTNADYAAWASNWLTRETGMVVKTAVLAAPGDLTPIAVARAIGAGWTGSIQGKVTVPPGVYRGNAFVIQDDTGGLYIYTGGTTLPSISLGDTVRITGTLKLYSGLLEIDPMTGIANLGSGVVPDPLNLTTGAVAANEGWLVQVTGTATLGTPPTPGASDFSFSINDGSGSVQVFVKKDTRIDMRGYTSGQQLTIIGFVSNYNGTRQIMPRYQSDIWDMLPPQVTATYPVASATDVYPYFPITATFSKALDAATVTAATFTLEDAGGAVAGTVSYANGAATFDPTAALAAQTRYTATLTTGIEDSHAIPMAADYAWSFITGDADTVAPTITGYTPAAEADDLPLSVNVVVTFSEALDPATLAGRFTLTGPYGAVPAALTYDAAAFVVTLNPSSNLLPTSRYTVTVAADVADWAGNTLGAAESWSFATAVEPPMAAYHGDIHNHTSYSDGSGTPTEALNAGKAAGFDFMAISDHSYAIDETEWADTLAAVEAATVNGSFVALRGFEYTQGAEGHINVYNTVRHAVRTNVAGCTTCDYTPNLEAGVTVQGFYPWLAVTGTHAIDGAGTVMQFNHPGWINFNDWTYHAEVSNTARLEEVGNGHGTSYAFSEDEYIRSLDYGWKVGATNNADTHSFYWGTNTPHRTGVWMPNLTKSDLLEALRERRTFATEDTNANLYLKANGAWMGTEIPNTGNVIFEIAYADPDGEIPAALHLISYGGQVVAEMTPTTADFLWSFDLSITPGVHYYYVKATQADGDRIVSSPVWTTGDENVAITDVVIQPTIPTIHNPSLLTARVTNRVAAPRTVTVTMAVNGVSLGAPIEVIVPANADAYANFTWQPAATGVATVTAALTAAPVGDNPDDNVGQLVLNVTDELLPLILIDAGHGNTNAAGREMRMFIKDLSDHQYNVLKNLDALTAADLNTATVKLLIINAPELAYTTAELDAIADFVAGGGSLWLCNIADYTGKVAWANTVANRLNAILDSVETRTGATINMRLNDDEVIDADDNNGYVFGVLWHDFPGEAATSIGLNVDTLASWSLSSIRGRTVNDPLTASTPGVQIIVQGDLDEGYGDAPWRNPNHTSNTDADNQGDAYIYNPTWVYPAGAPANALPVPMAAVSDLPGDAGRIMLYGDANDPFTTFAYTAGDGKQNELFNLESVMWLLGQPLQKSTIAAARADAELNNTPDNLDKLVWVEGKITAAYGEFFNVLYVQDETGGITVHAPAGDISATQYTRGTTVRVVGTLGAYNGDTEIEFFEAEMVQVITPAAGEVAPQALSTGDAALESNEGWLVQITGTVMSKVGAEAIVVDDGSGPIRAFLDGYNGDFSDITVGDVVTVKGLTSEDGAGRRIRVRNYQMHYPAIANDVTKLGALALTLDKSVTPTVAESPALFTYTLRLTNSGLVNAPDALMTDTLPAGLTFGGFVAANGATYADGVVAWSGVAPTAAPVTVVFTATATATGQTTQTITNTASFSAPGISSSDDAAVQVIPPALPLIVTEFLPDPDAVGDTAGEWIELYNPNAEAINLQGWIIGDLGTDDHTITRTVIVPAGGYIVLGRNADPVINGGVAVAYAYGADFTLANTSEDEIILTDALGREVDRVAYVFGSNGWPTVTAGRAFQLCNPAADNNQGSAWSRATSQWTPPLSDYGSPGLPNACGVIAISKAVFPQTGVAPGDALTYTVVVANTGGDAADVHVVDVLPLGVAGDDLDWTGLIAANTAITFTLPAAVTDSAAFYGQTLINTAAYTYLTHTGVATAAVTLVDAPQLVLAKTVTSAGAVFPGDEVVYTLILTNTGDMAIAGIALTDALPWEVDFGGWVAQNGATVAADVITWNGDLAAGATVAFSFRAVLRQDTIFLAHPVRNTASYLAGELHGSAEATFMLGGGAALALDKTVATPSQVLPGDSVTYTLLLSAGQGAVGGIVVTDVLPVALDFGSWVAQNGATVADDVITWNGALASGASHSISFKAVVHDDPALYGQMLTNAAAFTADNAAPGGDAVTFTVSTLVEEPVLRVDKVVAPLTNVAPGQAVTYMLTLANRGGAVATGVLLTDVLPVELDFGSWITQSGAAVANDTLTWSGDLAAGASHVFAFTAGLRSAVAPAGQTVTNTALASAANAASSSASAAFQVRTLVEQPIVHLDKVVAPLTNVAPGQTVTYTLTVSNTGAVQADAVYLSDVLPVELDFGGWIAQNGASVANDVITWNGALASGGRRVFVFTAVLKTATDGQTVTNTATFTATNATPGGDTASFTAYVPGPQPLLSLAKSVAAPATVKHGQSVTYTLVLSNTGPGIAASVRLTDVLPTELDFGGWVAQNGATVTNDVIAWNGDLAAGASRTFVFTATLRSDVTLDGRNVDNTARFTWGAISAEDTASFTLGIAQKIFLPLVARKLS